MTEANEVARGIAPQDQQFASLADAVHYVRGIMTDETAQVVDNVAQALWRTQQ